MNYMVGIGVFVLFVVLFMKGAKGAEETNDGNGEAVPDTGDGVTPPTEDSIKAALKRVRDLYGVDVAHNVERIYRLESGGLQNALLRATNAPGMQAVANSWPFGWKRRGTAADMFAPVVRMRENNPLTGVPQGNAVPFVAFKRINDAVEYVAKFLVDYGNNAGRWKSTNPTQQASYRAALAKFPTTWTDNP